jgi:hypothetical protein
MVAIAVTFCFTAAILFIALRALSVAGLRILEPFRRPLIGIGTGMFMGTVFLWTAMAALFLFTSEANGRVLFAEKGTLESREKGRRQSSTERLRDRKNETPVIAYQVGSSSYSLRALPAPRGSVLPGDAVTVHYFDSKPSRAWTTSDLLAIPVLMTLLTGFVLVLAVWG